MHNDYAVSQKVVHWLMSFLIILDLFVANKFGGAMEDWDRLESRSDHATVGTIVLCLFLYRLYLRYKHGAPPVPDSMTGWQVTAARWAHTLLYVLIGFLICTGILTGINATSEIQIFGQLTLSSGQTDDATFLFLRPFHEFATNAIIALIVLHIIAALYHELVKRDRTLIKMLKFWHREPLSGSSNEQA